MEIINGYRLTSEWKNSSNSKYTIGEKHGHDYFLKEFLMPVYPNKAGCTEKTYQKEIERCRLFETRQNRLINKMSEVAAKGGNLVIIEEFFRYGTKYYKATPFVSQGVLSKEEIKSLSLEKKLQIIKNLSHSIRSLHRVKIIHGDLKPDNILVVKNEVGRVKCKIIDFDDSYFEKDPPLSDEMIGDIQYYSPEIAKYILEEGNPKYKEQITCQSDVFTLGLIFHEYLTGHLPKLGKKYRYPFESVLDHQKLEIDSSIDSHLNGIIEGMLHHDYKERSSINDVFIKLTSLPTQIKAAKKNIQHIEKLNNNQYKVYFYNGSYLIMPKHVLTEYKKKMMI